MKEFSSKKEKIQYVLTSINEGKSTDEVAKELGYKNYKSLDMFMRREGYTKGKRLGNYVPKNGSNIIQIAPELHKASITTKALEVIQHFREGELSPRRIAHESGFETPKEMANYMKSKGFIWDPDRNNYVPQTGELEEEPENEKEEVEIKGDADVTGYLNLLEYLDSRKEKIAELLEQDLEGGSMPRYVVPGIFITKSVHMSNQIDQMVRDFSEDKNISQRDIFEVALIEFFKKYGYDKEVKIMLESIN